jgi:hypothetical protein
MIIDAKTIQIFLPDGEPRGIRIAEITTRIVQAVQVPRARLDRIMKREELDHIGMYFLFGESEEQAKPVAYIGQSEDLRGRLKQHHSTKDFWTTAVLLVSKTDSFTLAHIRYLEWHSINEATKAGRYALDNGNIPSKPFITEPIEADVLDAFDTGSILLSTLGFPLFDPVGGKKVAEDKETTFYCSGPNAKASGRLVDDGFVVFKGSTARSDHLRSMHKYMLTRRQTLLASSVLVEDGSALRFAEDYLFQSPSGAAMLVLGRTANGWLEWKTADGQTLRDVEKADVSS